MTFKSDPNWYMYDPKFYKISKLIIHIFAVQSLSSTIHVDDQDVQSWILPCCHLGDTERGTYGSVRVFAMLYDVLVNSTIIVNCFQIITIYLCICEKIIVNNLSLVAELHRKVFDQFQGNGW